MFSHLLASLLLWRPGIVGFPAVAFVPAVDGVHGVVCVLAVASIPADSGFPFFAVYFQTLL